MDLPQRFDPNTFINGSTPSTTDEISEDSTPSPYSINSETYKADKIKLINLDTY